ncbi:hypothetical protein NBCG_02888 [Nocardioidaceae bacterium Broad-1]|nr:hypothetical protein NBCG_02888 [Nocardioidaceae bacterium Broad-1]
MTTHAEQKADERLRCWCCDNEFPATEVVHLGAHPEVSICFDCARWVRRRALLRADAGRRGLRGGLRRTLAQTRAAVIGRGWHDRPVIGPILRWVDRRRP